MATYYVSKTDGNDSNNGLTKATAVATLPKAFELTAGAGSGGHTIEIIDNGVYHPSGSSSPWLPGMNGNINGNAANSIGTWANLTLKAGTDTAGNQVFPVLDGRETSASTGSYARRNTRVAASGNPTVSDAIQYFAGWTIEGLEFRCWPQAAARPYASMTTATLIFKNCIVHDMPSRDPGHTGAGSDNGCVSYLAADTGGDATSNIVENCIFYNIPKNVIGGAPNTAVTVRNCLIFNYGGAAEGGSNKVAINLNHADSLVEHCTIADYGGGKSSAHIPGVNMGGNDQGTVKNCFFHNIDTDHFVIEANKSISNLFVNIGGTPDGVSDSDGERTNEEGGGEQKGAGVPADDGTLLWNSSSTSSGFYDINNGLDCDGDAVTVTGDDVEEIGFILSNSGFPAYAYTSRSSIGVDQASGSSVTGDLGTNLGFIREKFGHASNRSRSSTAAGCNGDIGCFEFFREFSENNGLEQETIGDDFTINNSSANHMDNQYKVKLNDQQCIGEARAPFSKPMIKGVPTLRTLSTTIAYKLTKG